MILGSYKKDVLQMNCLDMVDADNEHREWEIRVTWVSNPDWMEFLISARIAADLSGVFGHYTDDEGINIIEPGELVEVSGCFEAYYRNRRQRLLPICGALPTPPIQVLSIKVVDVDPGTKETMVLLECRYKMIRIR